MKIMKRSLSILLSVLMIVTLFSIVSFSVEAETTSGTIGACTWNYDESTGTLTISGNGAMWGDSPWYWFYYFRDEIKTVDIQYGVTSIASYAFQKCTSLTSVTIPNSVMSIGDYAFYNCTSLKSITIPNSVTSMGDCAFSHCTSLTSLTIENSVMGDYAFSHCTSLTSVTIGNSVISIGKEAFSHCTSLTSVVIPNSVTSICGLAFYNCTSLTSVVIPNSVTSIGDSAFYECTRLSNITIPDNITSIGDAAFSKCDSLTSIIIPDSVTNIGDSAFCDCARLTSINVHADNPNYTSVDGNLYNKDRTTLIQYAIGKIASRFTIPDSVTYIGRYAFCHCQKLTSVTIPNSVTSIGNSAFSACTSLTSITIDNSVLNIGKYAFYYCTSLTSITIGNSVTNIGDSAFKSCTRLKNVYYSGTESDWNKISIDSNNEPLISATKYYMVNFSDPTTITLSVEKSTIIVNESVEVTATVINGVGNTTFSVSDSRIATVSDSGVVTGKSTGSVTVTAENYNVTASVIINVVNTSISLSEEKDTIYVDETTKVTPTVTNGFGSTSFFSSDTNVATVSENGIVIGKSEGTVTITATNNGKSASVKIYVIDTLITLTAGKTTINVGETTKATAKVKNPIGNTEYSSSDTRVATVSESGIITGKTEGTVTITATNNDKSASVRISVIKKESTLKAQTITAKSHTKTYGSKAFSLSAKTSGNGKLSYKSNNKKVVTVSSKGKVTIKGCGKATITIKASATSKYKAATKKITITVKPGKVKLTSRRFYTENGIYKVKQKFVQQNNCDGYELHVSLNSSFSPFVNYKYAKTRKDFIITSKTSGVKYYARFRAYKKIGKKTYYGKWTKVSFKV